LRDVFRKGDAYFRSGDLVTMDKFGWIFFKDRCGDTFRWRGENVSTTEVETIMSEIVSNNCSSSKTVVSYGVEIPGNEGRASMVAIVDSNEASSDNDETTEPVNMGDLYSSVEKKLPSYARPIFVRLTKSVETTGTHKIKKTAFQREGFDLKKITDQVFFMDVKQKKYVPLTNDLCQMINQGEIRI